MLSKRIFHVKKLILTFRLAQFFFLKKSHKVQRKVEVGGEVLNLKVTMSDSEHVDFLKMLMFLLR